MIVRDEEKNLPRALGSVQGLVDEMVIVDTGSTDRTMDVARSWGARVDRIEWTDDFAAARNHSLSLAKGDWILVLDADDEFERDDTPLAWQSIESTDAHGLTVRQSLPYPGVSGVSGVSGVVRDQLSLFRNAPEHRFVYRIHERISVNPSRVERTPIRVTHHGYTPDAMPGKLERNRRLLERMKTDPDSMARVAASYYLGSQLENQHRLEEACREYSLAAYSAIACEFRLYAVFGLARASVTRGDLGLAEKLFGTILESNPGALDAELGMADLRWRQGKWAGARDHFERATHSSLRIFPIPQEPWISFVRKRLETTLGSLTFNRFPS